MANRQEPESDIWKRYLALQLTPEEKAQMRQRAETVMEQARKEGVYEKLLALRGKVHLQYDVEELRKDRD